MELARPIAWTTTCGEPLAFASSTAQRSAARASSQENMGRTLSTNPALMMVSTMDGGSPWKRSMVARSSSGKDALYASMAARRSW